MSQKKLSLIIFGPLFTTAEILFNKQLEKAIEAKSGLLLAVTLPQDDCAKYVNGDSIDFNGLYRHNLDNAENFQLAVAILDGSDSDSGTCVEVGWRKGRDSNDIVVGVRTDFRASEDGHVNAMLRICDSIIYAPFISVDELAEKIATELFSIILTKVSSLDKGLNALGEIANAFDEIRPHRQIVQSV